MSSLSALRIDPQNAGKGPWWLAFSSFKGAKFLNDQTHAAAWCNGCLGAYVRREQCHDRKLVDQNLLSDVRTEEELRKQGESPDIHGRWFVLT